MLKSLAISLLLISNVLIVSCKGKNTPDPNFSFSNSDNILSNKRDIAPENMCEYESILLFLDKYTNRLEAELTEKDPEINSQIDSLKQKIASITKQQSPPEAEIAAYKAAIDSLVDKVGKKLNGKKIQSEAAEKLKSDWQSEYDALNTPIQGSCNAAKNLREKAEKGCDEKTEDCNAYINEMVSLLDDAKQGEKAVSNINAKMAAANLANQIVFADKKIAELKASSPAGIIGQLKDKKSPKDIAKNLTSFFEKNYTKERADDIAAAMIDTGTDTKEMAEIYKDLSLKNRKN
jgi:chaperonin cofactor prefoldin